MDMTFAAAGCGAVEENSIGNPEPVIGQNRATVAEDPGSNRILPRWRAVGLASPEAILRR